MHTNFEQNRERGLLSRHCRGAGTNGDVGTRLCEENRGLMNYSQYPTYMLAKGQKNSKANCLIFISLILFLLSYGQK